MIAPALTYRLPQQAVARCANGAFVVNRNYTHHFTGEWSISGNCAEWVKTTFSAKEMQSRFWDRRRMIPLRELVAIRDIEPAWVGREHVSVEVVIPDVDVVNAAHHLFWFGDRAQTRFLVGNAPASLGEWAGMALSFRGEFDSVKTNARAEFLRSLDHWPQLAAMRGDT